MFTKVKFAYSVNNQILKMAHHLMLVGYYLNLRYTPSHLKDPPLLETLVNPPEYQQFELHVANLLCPESDASQGSNGSWWRLG